MDRIIIAGLRELGVHGVLAEEQARPQPFEVDVEFSVDASAAGESDGLEDSDDYPAVAAADSRAVPRLPSLGTTSPLGDRPARLQAAVDGLAATPGVTSVAVSPVYETAPIGGPPQPDYLNAVVAVDTALSARALLGVAQRLERDADRVRRERWGPRTLDVDVLLVGDEEIHDDD